MTPTERRKRERERIASRWYWSESELVEHESSALLKRLAQQIVKVGDCWVRRGATTPMMYWAGKTWSAYRLAYALWVGDLPTGCHSVVHHRCENRLCLRPSHLVLMTKSEHGREHQRLRSEAA